MDNNKNLNIQGIILSNILCEKEKDLKKRAAPRYGVVLLLVTHVNQQPLTPSQNRNPNFNNQRLVFDLLYLTKSNDPNNQRIMSLKPHQKVSLMVDPFTIFTKPSRVKYLHHGYMNYTFKLWANNSELIKLSLPNPCNYKAKLKLNQAKQPTLLPEKFNSFLDQYKFKSQQNIQPSVKVVQRLETGLIRAISY